MNAIKLLRAENRHEEAYKLSASDLQVKPGDLWARRNHSWSLYYMIKKHVQAGEVAQARHFLEEFSAMGMGADEVLLHERMAYFIRVLDAGYLTAKQLVGEGKFSEAFHLQVGTDSPDLEQVAWTVYYLLRSHNKTGKPDKVTTGGILRQFREISESSKKLVFKLILQEVIKSPTDLWGSESQVLYLEHLGLFDVLDEEDFQKQEWEGKKIISLAERLHIAYSKALLGEKVDSAKIGAYLTDIVEARLEKFPGMLYVPYFKAKLLLGVGDRDAGIRAFLPFAKKKSDEFWVWQVFAEAYEGEGEVYFSCLCKAMTCKTKPEFLCGIKERMIAYFVKSGQYAWAKSELYTLLEIRNGQGWGLRSTHRDYLQSDWYNKTTAEAINYPEHTGAAEALIGIGRLGSYEVIVSHINTAKNLFGFLTADKRQGFGKYRQEPELWQVYLLEGRFGTGDFFEVKKLQKSETGEHTLLRQVQGKFTKQSHNAFGFVSGIFVDPQLVASRKLQHNDEVRGRAVLAPVKGKSEWSWKMVTIGEE